MNIENLEKWKFGITEGLCNELLDMVIKGKKRATTSSLAGFDFSGEKIPEVGEYSVITDWEGNPRCLVRTVQIVPMKYKDMTFDLARLEGEDENLESWRDNHERFFRQEGAEYGYEFSEELDIIFEEFEVIEIL